MAANDYRSLYDQYKLSNSTVVPQFTGTTAPEALQVGQQLQGQYDFAKQAGMQIDSDVNNVVSLDKDTALANEVRDNVHGKISGFAADRDWEHKGDDVRALGRYYAQRANELYAPVKQFQDYQKSLDEKDLDLTPQQKAGLIGISKASYQGLKKDPYGKFTGQFTGAPPAKNINMSKFVDDTMAGMKEFKDASKIDYVDQPGHEGYIVRRGSSTEFVTTARVDDALKQAMSLRPDVQAHIGQESDIAGFNAGRLNYDAMPDSNPMKQQLIAASGRLGIPMNQLAAKMASNSTANGITLAAHRYARDKYAYHKTENELTLQNDETYWKKKAEADNPSMFADAVTDVGQDISKQFGSADDIIDQRVKATNSIDDAQTRLNATKSTIAKDMGVKPDSLTDEDAMKYIAQKGPAALGEYKALQQAIQSNKATIEQNDAIRADALDIAIRKKNPGLVGGYSQLQSEAKNKLTEALSKNKLDIPLYDDKGKEVNRLNATSIKDFTVVDGDAEAGASGKGGYVTLKDDKGREYKMYTGFETGQGKTTPGAHNSVLNSDVEKVGAMFDGLDWKENYKQAAQNIRSNSITIPLINKVTANGETTKAGAWATRVAGVVRAGSGGLDVFDADNNKLDSGDTKDMKARIGNGKYDVIGVTKRGDGKLYVKLSVSVDPKADDPADQAKTIYVAADTNMANKLSRSAVEAGTRDGDVRAVQMGLALKPGSGYESVLGMGTTGRTIVYDRSKINSKGKAENGKPAYEIVPQISGTDSDALSYEVYELDEAGNRAPETTMSTSDAFDLGAQIDIWKQQGKTIQKNNVR